MFACRIISRPWSADPEINELLESWILGDTSIISLIQHSAHFSKLFNTFVNQMQSGAVAGNRIKNLQKRKHRFDSMQRPLGRFCLYFEAVLSTAVWISVHRTGKPKTVAQNFLRALTHEKLVMISMLADAADEAITLIRFLDTESVDGSEIQLEVQLFLSRMHHLFNEGRVSEVPGYCHHMLEQLKTPKGFLVDSVPKTIGTNSCLDLLSMKQSINTNM